MNEQSSLPSKHLKIPKRVKNPASVRRPETGKWHSSSLGGAAGSGKRLRHLENTQKLLIEDSFLVIIIGIIKLVLELLGNQSNWPGLPARDKLWTG